MWDQRYNVPGFVYGTEPNHFLREHVHYLKPAMHVLAVADGEGRNGVWLAGQGMQVLSVDSSSVAQAKARRLADERGVKMEFDCADMLGWNWGKERFDAVVGIFIQFADPVGREALFAGIRSTLKPGGLLLLQGYTQRQLEYRTGGPTALENLYTEPMLRGLLADFEILEMR